MICPKCHAETSDQSKYCGRCGTALGSVGVPSTTTQPQSTRCPSCGREVPAGKRFCGACGSKVGVQESAQQANPMPAVPAPALEKPIPPVTPPAAPAAQPSQAAGSGIRPAASPAFSRKPASAPPAPSLAESPSVRKRSPRAAITALVVIVLVLVGAGMWYALGVNLDVTTTPGEARLIVDGHVEGVTTAQGGRFSISHLKRGKHHVTLFRPGYQPWSETISLGFFERTHLLSVKLALPSYLLSVVTSPPGAHVRLDGKDVGTSDASGRLEIPNVPRGVHTVNASADGYPSTGRKFYLYAPQTVRVDLVALATQMRQREAMVLAQARALYRQRQFSQAISQCDQVLKYDPQNQSAASLKKQIEQTQAILGGK